MRASRARRARLLLVALTVGLLAAAAVVLTQPLAAFGFLAWAFPRVVWRVETREPLVALTFDDGPDPTYTPQVLDLLSRHQARATFFLVAGHARRLPRLVARIRAEGHEVANHSSGLRGTHRLDLETFERDLLDAEALLGLTAGRPKLFRPAGGLIRPSQLRALQRHGYRCILGSAYPYDPYRPPAAYMRWLVSKNLAPGVIVIFHDAGGDRSKSVEAVAGVLEEGRGRGFRFVSVGELLGYTSPATRLP